MDLYNNGVISLNPALPCEAPTRGRTLIVSGVARSGTSMVARVLQGAGIFMGAEMDDVVFEDHDFLRAIEAIPYEPAALERLARERDARHAVWGFKRPHLHTLGAEAIEMFRNPALVLTVRDPVAIAERNAIAEHREPADSLLEAMEDLQAMMRFAEAVTCPVMLISYEKAIRQPAQFIRRLLSFCGRTVPAAQEAGLLPLVEPDRPRYVESARREYDGYVDGLDGRFLCGWAWQRGLHLPVTVTVFRDGVAVRDQVAAEHRPDLHSQGIGIGYHGFSIDLTGLGFNESSRVSVRIAGRRHVLNQSGRTIAEMGGGSAQREADPLSPWLDFDAVPSLT